MKPNPRALRNVQIFRLQSLLEHYFLNVAEALVSYRLPTGAWSRPSSYVRVDRGLSVAAIVFDRAARQLHFVRQFRFPAYDFSAEGRDDNGWLIELVAGRVGSDEEPETALVREIAEEVGVAVQGVEPIARFFLSPGASTEQLHLYFSEVDQTSTQSLAAAQRARDEEYIERVSMTPEEFLRAVDASEIVDAKTICAAEWLRRNMHRLAS